ncbi:MAG: phosphoribosylaminoimidazolesuccinocarboxamide synthase [Acidobacteriota bacterium]|nr:phosphoribosylaminoimidazolesuccinocarboxamide synthase [Acidobacteriota bacterium]
MDRSTHTAILLESSLPGIKPFARGKVRDIYQLSGGRLLIVATDRLSAFDVVMAEGIPDKGRVLNQLSSFWFGRLQEVCRNHYLTSNTHDFPSELHPYTEALSGRSMMVRQSQPFPVECVVRGYLAGSGWKEYKETGEICGERLPARLAESSRIENPVFTPATKASSGHDENISFKRMETITGPETARKLRDLSIELYVRARDYAAKQGIILADTKFEWGLCQGEITLIDEALTPDSSRFWPLDGYAPGGPQPSFDKQFVRDYLESVHWNKKPPPPHLPQDVVRKTSEKYREALRRLSGRDIG